MDFYTLFIKLMHKVYRSCAFIQSFFKALSTEYDRLYTIINRLYKLFFFNEMDEKTCEFWEEKLQIEFPDGNIENRRSEIRSKWVAATKSTLRIIQKVCDSWKFGKVQTFFLDGYIDVRFVSDLGIPDDINKLKIAIDEVKPAHLGYDISYKYLLIENIHEVLTLEEMENIELNLFAFGRDEQ